jgi:hypothetical protein
MGSLYLLLVGGGWSTPSPVHFTPGKRPSTHCTRDRLGPRGLSARVWIISLPLRFHPRTVQSVASVWYAIPSERFNTEDFRCGNLYKEEIVIEMS